MGQICCTQKDLEDEKYSYANVKIQNLKKKQQNDGYEQDDIKTYLGNVQNLEVVSLSNFDRMSCIDGRSRVKSLGCAGGDASLFLLGCAAYEKISNSQLRQGQFQGLLTKYLSQKKKPMYMHTDMHAVEAIFKSLKSNLSQEEMQKQLLNPSSASLKEQLKPLLVKPEFIGCGPLKLTMQNPHTYQIKKELVEWFIDEFYALLWRKSPQVKLEILEGNHGEKAVCIFESSTHEIAPIISPYNQDNNKSVFIYHQQAEAQFRNKLAKIICIELQCKELERQLRAKMDEIGQIQFDFTSGKLASSLPIFKISLNTK